MLELRHVSKSFGPTRALRDVSFDVRSGEVHVLAGENGAGKSTLIRILAGALGDFEGEIWLEGRRRHFSRPDEATRAGIATIHQELSLIGPMSVADNLFLGERRGLFSLESSSRRRTEAARILGKIGLDVDPDAAVETLPLSLRQLVEIARALARDARIFVMDEPTSALAEPDAERLFSEIVRLRDEGRGIVFISHRLEEIFRLADRISVLRDGERVLTNDARELDEKRLVQAMVGQELAAPALRDAPEARPVRLEIADLCVADPRASGRLLLDRVSLEVHAGEVLGLAGLRGSGASELCHAVGGSLGKPQSGKLRLAGKAYQPHDVPSAISRGIVLLASDRKDSVLADLTILANATLSSLPRFSPGGVVAFGKERHAVQAVTDELRLVAASLSSAAGSLSGGNQQKVALARCLLAKPELLLLDEPTRGIDVRAKSDVHALIRELVTAGVSVVLVASDLDELLALSDRIAVLFRGKVVATLERGEWDKPRIVALEMGS